MKPDTKTIADRMQFFERSGEEVRQCMIYQELVITTQMLVKIEDRLRSINLGVGIMATCAFLAFIVWIVTGVLGP